MKIKFCLLFCLLFGVSVELQAKAQTFLGQFYVDSLVDKALYGFNSISDPSSGITTEKAILNAKNIAAKLRQLAINDVNRQYILFKVNELENQIYLEEHGLLAEKNQWRQKSLNDLIAIYNKELGKDRPQFELLIEYQNKLLELDENKSAIMLQSIEKRAQSLSDVLPELIDQLIAEDEIGNALEELAYCRKNEIFLSISKIELASLDAKLLTRQTLDETCRLIAASFDSVQQYLDNLKIADARRIATGTKIKIDIIKNDMLALPWSRLNDNYLRYELRINRKEDSLISKGMRSLKDNKITDAGSFIDSLYIFGVHPDKVKKLNSLLLAKVIQQKTPVQEASLYELYAMDEDTTDTYPVFKDLITAAKKRSIAQRDSMLKENSKNVHLSEVAELRQERLSAARESMEKRQSERKREDIRRSYDELVLIHKYIEKNDTTGALRYYLKVKKLLDANLEEHDLRQLQEFFNISSAAAVDSLHRNSQ